MTDSQLERTETDNGRDLTEPEPGTNPAGSEARTQRPRAAVRKAARQGITLAVENQPAPLPDGLCEAIAKERSRALALLRAERIAARINLVLNLEAAVAKGSTLAAVHVRLATFAREDGRSDAEIAAAGVLVVHRGRV